MIPRRARNHRCSRESLPPRQTELRRTSSGRPFVLSYQDAPSKPEVGGVTIMTLLVRWGPRAGRKPHRLVAKGGSEKKGRRASWGDPEAGAADGR